MKIYLEGSVEEIEQFLYGEGEDETVCDECKYERSEMSPNEKLKLNLINAFANTIDVLINSKPQD